MRPSSFVRTILFLNLIFPQTMREWERMSSFSTHPISPSLSHQSTVFPYFMEYVWIIFLYVYVCDWICVWKWKPLCADEMFGLVWSDRTFWLLIFFKKTRIECYPWQRRLHQTKYHVSHSITGKWTGCYYVECWSLSHILLLLWLLMLLLLLWLRWWLQLLQLLLLAVCNVIVIIF